MHTPASGHEFIAFFEKDIRGHTRIVQEGCGDLYDLNRLVRKWERVGFTFAGVVRVGYEKPNGATRPA